MLITKGKNIVFPEIHLGTRGIAFKFPDPQGMANCHSRNPRGMKIAWELASLATTALYYLVYKTQCWTEGRRSMAVAEDF